MKFCLIIKKFENKILLILIQKNTMFKNSKKTMKARNKL